jgi:hypothetical protein
VLLYGSSLFTRPAWLFHCGPAIGIAVKSLFTVLAIYNFNWHRISLIANHIPIKMKYVKVQFANSADFNTSQSKWAILWSVSIWTQQLIVTIFLPQSRLKPVYTLTYFRKISFNIILPSRSWSPKLFFSSDDPSGCLIRATSLLTRAVSLWTVYFKTSFKDSVKKINCCYWFTG